MTRIAALIDVPHFTPALVWWLAHHQAVGFSTILANVHAEDLAACDLMDTAAQLNDVRWQHREAVDAPASLSALIQTQGLDLDWVLPLAEDEYFLPTTGTVRDFLKTVSPSAPQLAVNWCITGFNSHTPEAGPLQAPRALYTRHAPLPLPDHRITRSFFQPATHQSLPDPFAQVDREADWSQARILHDATSTSQGAAQRYYNRHEESWPEGTRLLPETRHHAAALVQTGLYRLWNFLKISTLPDTSLLPAPLVGSLLLQDETERLLVISRETGHMRWTPQAAQRPEETPLVLTILQSDPTRGWLAPSAPLALPYLPHAQPDQQTLPELLALHAVRIDFHRTAPNTCQLHHALTGGKVSLPQNLLPHLSPHKRPQLAENRAQNSLADLLRFGLTAEGIRQAVCISPNAPDPSVLGSVLAQLPPEERQTLLSSTSF